MNSSPGVRHDVSESSSLQELHDDPQLVSHQVAVVHLHHVLVVIVSHDHHLQLQRKQTGYSYFTHLTEKKVEVASQVERLLCICEVDATEISHNSVRE